MPALTCYPALLQSGAAFLGYTRFDGAKGGLAVFLDPVVNQAKGWFFKGSCGTQE
jgi:hypothetical protein